MRNLVIAMALLISAVAFAGSLYWLGNITNYSMKVFGTEYKPYDNGTIWLQMLVNYTPVTDASCYATAFYPDKTYFYHEELMTKLATEDGIYYLDFPVPDVIGVYMLTANCFVPSVSWSDLFDNTSKTEASANITVSDGEAKLSTYNATISYNYTDETWENSELLMQTDDIVAVDYDLGNISAVNITNITVCFFASREKTSLFTNVTNNVTRIANITLPQLAQPTAWTCVNISKSKFHDGINRIGLQCTKACTVSDNIVIKIDTTTPDNNSWWYGNSTSIWYNASFSDYGEKIYYTNPQYYTQGWLRSVPIDLNGSFWSSFETDYLNNSGLLEFSVQNSTNQTQCSLLGDISACANTTSPIKLYAVFNGTNASTPELLKWWVSWTTETVQETRGVGEFHVSALDPYVNIEIVPSA